MKNKQKITKEDESDINIGIIREKIYIIRSRKVMFDKDLAMLYEVPTKRLNEAVKRNIKRFPEDFMFQLNKTESELFSRSQFATLNEEDSILRSQIATLKNKTFINQGKTDNLRSQFATSSWGGQAYSPYVFTEQGIAMLSSVLKSDKAISVNIQIIRIFTKLREMIDTYKELREKVEEMEKSNTKTFHQIFDIIKSIIKEKDEPDKPRNQIGFTAPLD
jgi:ORF6N domain